ncbi:MAG: hypothetical protein EOP06_17465 [Proteobacteria bacterium]|nr:MAG: hypothetical protein EOP06_17465 [Pseudomonadota bacterium]
MNTRSFLSQIATILGLMTAVGFGLGTGTASAVPQQSIEQNYVSTSQMGFDKIEVHSSSKCGSNLASVSGYYNGEGRVSVKIERSLDPNDWTLTGQSSDGLTSRKDGPGGTPTVYETNSNTVQLDRAADREIDGRVIGQTFAIEWIVNPDEVAYYHVQITDAEQPEGARVWSLPIVGDASPFCSRNDIIYFDQEPLAPAA